MQIVFILKVGREFGVSYGHFYRSLFIAKNKFFKNSNLLFVTNKNLKIKVICKKYNIQNIQLLNFNLKNIERTIQNISNNITFVDLPREYKKLYLKFKFKRKVLISDSEIKRKKYNYLINYSILNAKKKINNSEFFGPKYFFDNSYNEATNIKIIKKVFVTFGGSDFHNYGEQIANIVTKINLEKVRFIINFGPGFKKKKFDNIKKKFSKQKIIFLYNSQNYEKYLKESDLVISGGGITAYKVAKSLKPLFIIPGSVFEEKIANKLNELKCAIKLKTFKNKLNEIYFQKIITEAQENKNYFLPMVKMQRKIFFPNKFNATLKKITTFFK